MSKEKQIEEIFNDMIEAEHRFHEYCLVNTCHDCEYYGDGECDNHIRAEYLYNAGYRKQNEGEWAQEYYPYRVFCSNCKTEARADRDGYYSTSTFCPNCGAHMKGGE